MKDLTYVVRLTLDRTTAPLACTVTGYEDERETYRVVIGYGPFDSWEDVLRVVQRALDAQLTLW